jgi:N-acetylglucosamine malate deacetylase 1
MSHSSVLVVAAHPDDEVLGCGGTIARHCAAGDRVAVLILADGVTSRGNIAPADLKERQSAARNANAILGVQDVTLLAYPDNRMDEVVLLDVVKDVEQLIARCQPDTIYTHHAGDVNIDHRRVHDAVIAACRPQPGHSVRRLLFCETPSSTEWRPPASQPVFAPNWYVDISLTLQIKLQALATYQAELREFPHPRSLQGVKHLAGWRGACVGVVAAEAFELGRLIDRCD